MNRSFNVLYSFLVFATIIVLPSLEYFILPALATRYSLLATDFPGFWSPGLATMLIIAGLILGLIIFNLSKLKSSFRQDSPFIGGETAVLEESRVSGTEFYNTVKEINILSKIYKLAEAKFFDIYDQGKGLTFWITNPLRNLHNGILPTYLVWCLLGMIIMFFVLR